jgi:hypothetical protein
VAHRRLGRPYPRYPSQAAARDKQAAKTFCRKLLKGHQVPPRVIVTDKLTSYEATKRELLPGVDHCQHRSLHNRAENFHQPTRHRDDACSGSSRLGTPSGSWRPIGRPPIISCHDIIAIPHQPAVRRCSNDSLPGRISWAFCRIRGYDSGSRVPTCQLLMSGDNNLLKWTRLFPVRLRYASVVAISSTTIP